MENTSQNIPLFQQDITYTSFNKAKTIQENDKKLYFTYDANNTRIKTKLVGLNGSNETTLRTHYYLGNYEEITEGSDHFAINYISASDGITAIVVTKNSQLAKMYFTYKDNLESIVALTNTNGDVVYKQNFDAWGRRRNPGDWTYSNITPSPSWLRGYTGHEHLPNFHLINMNGRMYAPIIARMLSPDNFVQDATFTQNYNRYSYVYNNPLKYNDPSGEFAVADSWLMGFVHGFFSTSSGRWKAGWQEANLRAWNDIKIWGGLFISDPNKNFWGRLGETVSRFTWQGIQTGVGFLSAQFTNTLGLKGGVRSVNYKYGATVVSTRKSWEMGPAFTLGSYINGDNLLYPNANNRVFQHEYGHYLQSQTVGIAYLGGYAIPSLLSKKGNDIPYHYPRFHPVELDADRRAFIYFNKNIPGFYKSKENMLANHGWDFYYNPLVSYQKYYGYSGAYIDYHSLSQLETLNESLKVSPTWYDYFLPILSGFINAYIYNH